MKDKLCEQYVQEALKSSENVKTMVKAMEKAGCNLPSNFFSVGKCGDAVGGGFSIPKGITICSNQMGTYREVENLLIHELIHAYDTCRAANVDWTNCRQHACSEIRASNLSGDCSWVEEWKRGNVNIRAQHQKCVMRRAELSVALNPFCKKSNKAKCAVEDVFDSCIKDYSPFDKIP